MAAADISALSKNRARHDFHGEGNYTISPKSKALRLSFADGAYDADPAH